MTGFAGGVDWGAVIHSEGRAELVLAKVSRIDRRAPDAAAAQPGRRRRITLVTQRLPASPTGHVLVAEARRQLDAATKGMLDVALAAGVDDWITVLRDPAQDQDRRDWVRQLVPDCYSEASRELIRIASSVWLFGGPGTFSDHGEVPPHLAATLGDASAKLYGACVSALESAANSTWFEV
jgi:hypothetical protein